MKKTILSILFICFVFGSIGQNINGYYVTGWSKLEAKRAFVIDLDTFYATTQLSGLDTTLVSLGYLTQELGGYIPRITSTDNAIARFDGTTGSLQNSSVIIADNGQIQSSVTTGTSPLTVSSTTMVTNLNSDLLDGQHGSYYQPLITNPVSGTGTANYIPKWGVGGTSLANSLIYDNGTNVGIGTTSPSQSLDVNGSARFRGVLGTTAATTLLGQTVDGTLTTNVTIDTTDITGLLNFVENHSVSSYSETDPIWSAAATNYYTKTNVQTSGQASIHWDNITNEPTFLTSNQSITLSGDVSGTGTTSITTTVADDSHNHTGTTAPGTYTSLASFGGLGTTGSNLYLSSINAAGGTPALTEYVHSLPSSGSTVKAVTWQAVKDMMGVSSGTVTSVGMTTPTGLTVTGSPITTSGTLALSLTSGYSIPTTANQTNWTAGYNDKINSAAFSTSTGVLTLTQQDAGTITVDLDGKYNEMWVDQTGRTYLSDTNEDLIIGSSTDAGAFKIQAVTSTTSGAGLYVSSTGTNSEGLYVSSSGTAGRGALITGTSYGVQSGGAINDFYGSNSGNIRLVEKASAAATAISSGVFYALSNGTAGYRNSSGADFNLTGTSMPTRTVSTSVTLGMTDYLVFLSSGANITLPTASSYTGKIYILRNTSSGDITISSYTVLGPSNATSVAAYQSVTVASNGSGWYQLN